MDLTKKPYKKGMDLTPPEEDWARKAAQAAKGIPILARPLKGAKTYHTSIRVLERLHRIAEEIKDSSNRYATMSDVYRASIYVGLNVLYEVTRDEFEKNSFLHNLFTLLRKGEVVNQEMLGLDFLVDLAMVYKNRLEAEVITKDEFRKSVDEIMENLPSHLWGPARKKINRVLNGELCSNLYECQYDGKFRSIKDNQGT